MRLPLGSLEHKFIPAPIPAVDQGPKTILILAHGRGGKWTLMEWLSKRFKIPGLDYLCIQAPFPEDVPEMKAAGFSWYIMPKHQGIEKSRDTIQKLLQQLMDSGYSPERILWLGFSQGGVMAIDTALRSNILFGGFVCVSGFVIKIEEYPRAFGKFAKEQNLLCTYGSRDPIVPPEKALRSFQALEALGGPLHYQEYDKPHSFELRKEIPDLEKKIKDWMK